MLAPPAAECWQGQDVHKRIKLAKQACLSPPKEASMATIPNTAWSQGQRRTGHQDRAATPTANKMSPRQELGRKKPAVGTSHCRLLSWTEQPWRRRADRQSTPPWPGGTWTEACWHHRSGPSARIARPDGSRLVNSMLLSIINANGCQ